MVNQCAKGRIFVFPVYSKQYQTSEKVVMEEKRVVQLVTTSKDSLYSWSL